MMAMLVALSVLNLALLLCVVVMLRRLRRRILKVRRAQRTGHRYALRHHGSVNHLYQELESLIGLHRLLDGAPDLPSLRFISVSPDFMLCVLRSIQQHTPRRIVECGSGSSTIAMALALRAFGVDGHIYSIENHEPSITMVRAQLRRHDLERFVTLVSVPLVPK